MKCELLKIKKGEIREICSGLIIARLRNDILLIESSTFKKFLGNIFKKETNGKQLESLVDIESKENLISTQELEINSLQKKILQLKDEQENQLASLKGKYSVLTKRLENYTSGRDEELEVVRDRYKKHISKLEDDCIKAIDERNECKNKLNKTTEILKQTEKEKKIYISYLEATERKKVYIRKQRNEYKILVEEMMEDKKKLEKLEKLKSKKAEQSDYLTELSKIGSLEIIVEKIFFESPDMTGEQAITLLKKVKNPVGKRRWRAATIRNRVDTYLKRRDEFKQHLKKAPYNINRETNRWGESILHDPYTQKVYDSLHVYLTKIGVKELTNILNESSSEVLTANEMRNLILSTLSRIGIKVSNYTYRGYSVYLVLSGRLISSGRGKSLRYIIKERR